MTVRLNILSYIDARLYGRIVHAPLVHIRRLLNVLEHLSPGILLRSHGILCPPIWRALVHTAACSATLIFLAGEQYHADLATAIRQVRAV
jgi:hypothetical protein